LARALATCRLLERERLHGAAIRVGVQRRDGRFVAHAWVDFAGERLNESESDATDLLELSGLRVETGR
jgi:hypothetical protein